MKTQVKLLDSAKQGNLDALVALINQPLEHRQIVASASLSHRCLTITAEAPTEPPGRLFFVDFVKQGINTLRPRGVERVIVQGKCKHDSDVIWHDQFEVDTPNLEASDLSQSARSQGASSEDVDSPSTATAESATASPLDFSASSSPELLEPDGAEIQFSQAVSSSADDADIAFPESAHSPTDVQSLYAESPVNSPSVRHRSTRTLSDPPNPIAHAPGPSPTGASRYVMNHAFSFLWASSFLLGCLLTVSVLSWFMPQRIARNQWEYRIVSIADSDFNLAIQELGDEGWELSYARRAIAEDGDLEYSLYELILKRPKSFLD